MAPIFIYHLLQKHLCIATCKQFRVHIAEGINYEREQKTDKFTQLNHGWTAGIHAVDKYKMRKEIVMQLGFKPICLGKADRKVHLCHLLSAMVSMVTTPSSKIHAKSLPCCTATPVVH